VAITLSAMPDVIEKLNHSTIQHGSSNRRIYLMKLHEGDMPSIVPVLEQLAREKGYEKILVKAPSPYKDGFAKEGYDQEAIIPHYFKDREDAVFMAKYFSPIRRRVKDRQRIIAVLSLAQRYERTRSHKTTDCFFGVKICRPDDTAEMSRLFKAVFKTYPFPVFDPHYLIESINSHVTYFCIRKDNRIVALAASEKDSDNRAVEMTDFATLSGHRRQGMASCLLRAMEKEMIQQGLKTAYSIARSLSADMNITFVKNGYRYGGTLGNNTNIAGRIESMNIWYKPL
jgi:putative beta-lysine N-acetyltransferase